VSQSRVLWDRIFTESVAADTGFEAALIVTGKPIQGRRMKAMNAHFYSVLALILFVFFLCFRFRKENRKK